MAKTHVLSVLFRIECFFEVVRNIFEPLECSILACCVRPRLKDTQNADPVNFASFTALWTGGRGRIRFSVNPTLAVAFEINKLRLGAITIRLSDLYPWPRNRPEHVRQTLMSRKVDYSCTSAAILGIEPKKRDIHSPDSFDVLFSTFGHHE